MVYKRFGLKIETEERGVRVWRGIIPFRKKSFYPYSNIAGVEVTGATKRLSLRTNDGKNYNLSIGMTKVGRLQKDIEGRI